MSTASQVESFCESCGTRYAFEPRRSAKRHLVKVGRLVGILADEPEVDDSALIASRDPFHGAFHFCLECRRFTCPTCWDATAGFCRACSAVLSGGADADEPEYVLDADTQALLRAALQDLAGLGSGDAWRDLQPPPEARPAIVAVTSDIGEAPADDLAHIIEAGVAAKAAREAREAREAAEAAELEQVRLEAERQQQAEAERVAAEQAEAQRLAWQEYEAQKAQYEADLAAWEAAEARRLREPAAEPPMDEPGETGPIAAVAGAYVADATEADAVEVDQATAEPIAGAVPTLVAEGADITQTPDVALGLEAQEPDESVWDTLVGALGPDIAAEAGLEPPPTRPQLPPVPQVPPPPAPNGAWQMGGPPAGMPGWAPPAARGFGPPAAHWAGGRQPVGHGIDAPLRSGVRPCPRCELALSANARFCRRCGLPQG